MALLFLDSRYPGYLKGGSITNQIFARPFDVLFLFGGAERCRPWLDIVSRDREECPPKVLVKGHDYYLYACTRVNWLSCSSYLGG